MAGLDQTLLQTFLSKYPNDPKLPMQYGTSGFRYKAQNLPPIAFRVGIFASLRARFTQAAVGIVITASHNPEEDNGIKIVDPSGGMLEDTWEPLVSELVNAPDADLEKNVQDLVAKHKIDMSRVAKVFVGRDTRSSSAGLCAALCEGIQVAGGCCTNLGILTTPQLHYIIRCVNSNGLYGEPTEDGYYQKLSTAYISLAELIGCNEQYKPHLVVDGSNGVGALKMSSLAPYLKGKLTFEVIHDKNGILNHLCGADYVKVNQKQPASITLLPGQRYCSFDGDADRIIYYYLNSRDGKFHMLDGDKIAVLVAKYLTEMLHKAQLDNVEVAIVQTAYANGSSTIYMRDVLHLQTYCVPTGVKHLHRKAEKCDIGIYFEANGHGTILFSDKVHNKIRNIQDNSSAQQLLHFINLVNQTVGDAISDMLVVETILNSLNLTIEQWDDFYTDLPNRLLKLAVKDRNAIVTTDAERRCVQPPGMQEAIDAVIAHYGTRARSFVRPSGTEDVVRIYAEADSQEAADTLARKVANVVFDFANGVGEKYSVE